MKKINNNSFKKALSKFATGVAIITINDKNVYIGKTINSFSALSLKPPLILFSLDNKSSSIKKFKKSKHIGINFLSKKQKKLSKYFAIKNIDWGKTKFFLSKNNVPMIKGSIVQLDCQKKETLTKGDHIIFICKILNLKISNTLKPLIYHNGNYY